MSLHHQRGVVDALLDDRPERIVGLAADDKDLVGVLRHGAAGRHQRRRCHQRCGNAFHMSHDLPPPVSLSARFHFAG